LPRQHLQSHSNQYAQSSVCHGSACIIIPW
jgi:hypothetical protein